METVKAFVRQDDTVTIVCPACKTPKNISVKSFKNKTHYLKVRCTCEEVFRVHLDFRQFYRKPTNLEGHYKTLKPAGQGGGIIHIRNISQGGIGFTVSGINTIEKGHRLLVTFELDDKRRTKLQKEVVVQSVTDNFIGCRFASSQAYEKELGFYLKT
ncbi:MAG: hypothetical protein Kow0089_17850 [Desulfobulbaceae bacterium]